MLKTIPSRILAHSCVLRVPAADAWGEAAWESHAISRVNIQPSHRVIIGKDAKQRELAAVMFYDCRLSQGAEDLAAWQAEAEAANRPLEIDWQGNTYSVIAIDWLCDDEGNPHHWEVGLC